MTAGMVRTQVVFQEPIKNDSNRDGSGRVDLTDDSNWSEYCSRRAKFETRGGRVFEQARQIHSELSHVFKIRADEKTKAINTMMRVKVGTRKMNILSSFVLYEQRGRWIQISCKEIVS